MKNRQEMEEKNIIIHFVKMSQKNNKDISTACTGNYIFMRNLTGSLSLFLKKVGKKEDIFIPICWLKKYKSNPKEKQAIYCLKV